MPVLPVPVPPVPVRGAEKKKRPVVVVLEVRTGYEWRVQELIRCWSERRPPPPPPPPTTAEAVAFGGEIITE